MTNKFVKSLLFILICISTLSLAYMVSNDSQDHQIMQRFELNGYTQLSIPDQINTQADYQGVLQTIEGVSKQTDTPFVLRSLYGGNENDGKGNVNLVQSLVKLNLFQTNFTAKEARTFNAHGVKTLVQNSPFSSLDFEHFTFSDFFVGGNHQEAALNKIIADINGQFNLNMSQSDWQEVTKPGTHGQNPLMLNNYDLVGAVIISLIFFVVFLFVWLIQNNRVITIRRLNGQSVERIANEIFLRPFLLVTLFSSLLGTTVILQTVSPRYLIYMVILCLTVFTLTNFSIWFVTRMSLVNQINSKPVMKYSYGVVFLIKVSVFLISLSMISNVTVLFNQSLALSGNQTLKNYGALYPVLTGYGIKNAMFGSGGQELFVAAENLGAWHSNFNSLLSQSSLSNLSATEVDSNYLQKYPLLGENGRKISIDTNSHNGIVLLSSKLKSKVSDIKKEVNASSETFKGQGFDYVYIKDNQKIYIPGERNRWTNADVCLVYTKSNATPLFISSIINGDPYNFLIPIKHDIENTYRELLPAMKKDLIASNYPSLIPINQIPKVDMLLIVGSPLSYIFGQVFTFALFLCMIILSTLFYFRAYQRQIAIKRLQGLSIPKSYALLYAGVALQYLLGAITAVTQGGALLFETLLFILLIEIGVIWLMIRRTNKEAILEILKGDN